MSNSSEGNDALYVMVRGRQQGKTTAALEWVAQGQRMGAYPGWTRVLVVATVQMEMDMRGWKDAAGVAWWDRIEDWSHRVYDQITWAGRFRSYRVGPEVLVDDLTLCLLHCGGEMPRIFKYDRVVGFTVNGKIWDPQPGKEQA